MIGSRASRSSSKRHDDGTDDTTKLESIIGDPKKTKASDFILILMHQELHHTQDISSVLANKITSSVGYNAAGLKGEELITRTLADGRTCLLKITFFHTNNSFIIMMFFLFSPRPVVLHSILISMLNGSEQKYNMN